MPRKFSLAKRFLTAFSCAAMLLVFPALGATLQVIEARQTSVVVQINNNDPVTMKLNAVIDGVRLLSIDGDYVQFLILGDPRWIKVGQLTIVDDSVFQHMVDLDSQLRTTIRQENTFRKVKEVRIPLGKDYVYRVPGSINGIATEFVVDTGASFVAMSRGLAAKIGLAVERGTPASVKTASGTMNSYVGNCAEIRVGQIRVQGVQCTIATQDRIGSALSNQVLLGNSFLSRLAAAHLENGVLTLRQED